MHVPNINEEITQLVKAGVKVELVIVSDQLYVLARGTEAPNPPWNRSTYDVLISVPAAYNDGAALDAFYLALPYTYDSATHPRVSGGTVAVDGRDWQLVSWHYPDGRGWLVGSDCLESHLVHCKGFFFHRGATNDR